MKKGIWVGVCLTIIFYLTLTPLAQEAVLWIDKFLSGPTGVAIPEGWSLEEKAGTVDVKIEKLKEGYYVQFRSDSSSFGLKKEMDFDLKEFPYLNWKWKVTRLPEKGDFLKQESDDQAAQLYVLFPRFPTKLNTEFVGYLWESSPKNKGKEGESPAWSKSKVIVQKAGPEKLNKWVSEKRNVYEDYKRLFGKEPPNVGGVAFYINTQHTKGKAESALGPLYFSKN
jgi:hypothetical protein